MISTHAILLHMPCVLAQSGGQARGVSLLQTIEAGGTIGYLIILLSVLALALIVRHMLQIRSSSLAPREAIDALHEMLGKHDTQGAIRYCDEPQYSSFLTRIIGAGLKRAQRSPFGSLELRAALEEAGQTEVARLYRSTDGLGLIAAIAPMLGLLGTVVGMVGAFNTISSAEGFARPDQLAGDISKALVTTLMGLVLAIPCMAAFTFFRNRIDTVGGEIESVVEEIASHLDENQQAAPGASQRAQTPHAGSPLGAPAGAGARGGRA